MQSYVHNISGRLRIKNNLFKNKEIQYEVKKVLVNMGYGIGTVEFNSVTGSMLINYNETMIKGKDILNMLESKGYYSPEKVVTNDQAVNKIASEAINLALNMFVGNTIERMLLSLL
jgi:hypothetical protein